MAARSRRPRTRSDSVPLPDRAKSRSPLLPFYAILGVVALAGAAFLGFQLFGREPGATQPVPVNLTAADLNRVAGIGMGEANAPLQIFEFADFQCPACASFATFVTPLVKRDFVETGKARYVYYDYPLIQIHPNAFLSARAGRCANEQGGFWPVHDLLYGRQSEWSRATDPSGIFIEIAGTAGLDRARFESCLRSDRFAREITESMQLAESLGVNGTPTLIVNGKRLPDINHGVTSPEYYRELKRLLEQELAGAPAAATTPSAPVSAADSAATAAAPAGASAPAANPAAPPR